MRQFVLGLRMIGFETNRLAVYPMEIFANIASRIIELILYITFWLIVTKHGTNVGFSSREIISYYLVTTGLISFFFLNFGAGSRIAEMIKGGMITKALLQPVNSLLYPWSERIGRNVVNNIFGAIFIISGLLVGGVRSVDYWKIIVITAPMMLISVAFNILIGTVGFYTGEARNVKNILLHLSRIFRGDVMPIFMMPLAVQNILYNSPFPSTQYYLAQALRGQNVSNIHIMVGMGWGVVLFAASIVWWRYSLRKYEALGL